MEPELLDQVKNLCKRCGEYRGCEGECTKKTCKITDEKELGCFQFMSCSVFSKAMSASTTC